MTRENDEIEKGLQELKEQMLAFSEEKFKISEKNIETRKSFNDKAKKALKGRLNYNIYTDKNQATWVVNKYEEVLKEKKDEIKLAVELIRKIILAMKTPMEAGKSAKGPNEKITNVDDIENEEDIFEGGVDADKGVRNVRGGVKDLIKERLPEENVNNILNCLDPFPVDGVKQEVKVDKVIQAILNKVSNSDPTKNEFISEALEFYVNGNDEMGITADDVDSLIESHVVSKELDEGIVDAASKLTAEQSSFLSLANDGKLEGTKFFARNCKKDKKDKKDTTEFDIADDDERKKFRKFLKKLNDNSVSDNSVSGKIQFSDSGPVKIYGSLNRIIPKIKNALNKVKKSEAEEELLKLGERRDRMSNRAGIYLFYHMFRGMSYLGNKFSVDPATYPKLSCIPGSSLFNMMGRIGSRTLAKFHQDSDEDRFAKYKNREKELKVKSQNFRKEMKKAKFPLKALFAIRNASSWLSSTVATGIASATGFLGMGADYCASGLDNIASKCERSKFTKSIFAPIFRVAAFIVKGPKLFFQAITAPLLTIAEGHSIESQGRVEGIRRFNNHPKRVFTARFEQKDAEDLNKKVPNIAHNLISDKYTLEDYLDNESYDGKQLENLCRVILRDKKDCQFKEVNIDNKDTVLIPICTVKFGKQVPYKIFGDATGKEIKIKIAGKYVDINEAEGAIENMGVYSEGKLENFKDEIFEEIKEYAQNINSEDSTGISLKEFRDIELKKDKSTIAISGAQGARVDIKSAHAFLELQNPELKAELTKSDSNKTSTSFLSGSERSRIDKVIAETRSGLAKAAVGDTKAGVGNALANFLNQEDVLGNSNSGGAAR